MLSMERRWIRLLAATAMIGSFIGTLFVDATFVSSSVFETNVCRTDAGNFYGTIGTVGKQSRRSTPLTSIYVKRSREDTQDKTKQTIDQKHEKRVEDVELPQVSQYLYRKPKQKRRKPTKARRPPAFWSDMKNVEVELRAFWEDLDVPISPHIPPIIPSETLLNHFERNDLRYAIAHHGGREAIAERLGAKLVPGKWSDAVKYCQEVKELLRGDNPNGKGLSVDVPPIARHVKRALERKLKGEKMRTCRDERNCNIVECLEENLNNDVFTLRYQGGERWAHQSGRNPRGHWNRDLVIKELYNYLKLIKNETGRPSIWMPRPSELSTNGRDDLKSAMFRYGGAAKICDLAKLIKYKEWRYFESSLELFVELQRYLVIHCDGREDVFPKLADLRGYEHERLYDLVMEFGGRKVIAQKLGMTYQAQTSPGVFRGMSFGPFSLDFAIRLLTVIRLEMMNLEPPLDEPEIKMPTTRWLLDHGHDTLAREVKQYGGHENVARRLHLGFDEAEANADALARKTTAERNDAK